MFEGAAAGIGAALSAAFMGLASTQKRHAENRDCLIRLSSSLEQVSDRLEELHQDLRSERLEIFTRLSAAERAIARLEGRQNQN